MTSILTDLLLIVIKVLSFFIFLIMILLYSRADQFQLGVLFVANYIKQTKTPNLIKAKYKNKTYHHGKKLMLPHIPCHLLNATASQKQIFQY